MDTQTIKAPYHETNGGKWVFTPLDRTCLDMVIKGTWLFTYRIDAETLKGSLAVILGLYPHLSGRINPGGYVDMNNEGVSFSVDHKPSATLDDIRRDDGAADRYSTGIDLRKAKKGEAPLLAVTLTHLKDGSVLSVHCAHVCMDGSAFYSMMRNWALISRGGPVKPPVMDQSLVPVPDGQLSKEAVMDEVAGMGWHGVSFTLLLSHIWQGITGVAKTRTKAIHIPDEVITRLKESVSQRSGKQYGNHAVLSALIARMCLELSGVPDGAECSVLSVVDARGRAGNIPPGFAGNAVSNIPSESFNAAASPEAVAQAVDGRLKEILSDPGKLGHYMLLNMYAMEYKLPLVPFDLKGMNSKRPTTIYINNFSRFPMYDIDFGHGRPVQIIPHDLPDMVKLFPTPDGQGVDIYLMG